MPLRGWVVKIFQRGSVDKMFIEANAFQFNPSMLETTRVVPFWISAQLPKTSDPLKNTPEINGIQPSLGGEYTT
jgi:hypothetical protein